MLVDDQEPRLPEYYVVSRHMQDADCILHALRLTPIDIAIVTNVLDYDYATQLCNAVILTDDAEKTRLSLNRRVLILGEADFIDAVYADGRRESLAARA